MKFTCESARIGIIGTGRVGPSLGKVMKGAGLNVVGVWGRSEEGVREASLFVGCEGFRELGSLFDSSDVVFVAVKDDALRSVSDSILSLGNIIEGKLISHTSGSHPSTVFSSLKNRGAFVASFHPLQSISSKERGVEVLRGAYIAIEGDKEVVDFLFSVARRIGCRPFRIETKFKALYHASAVMSCNLLYALYWLSCQLLSICGVDEDLREKVLLPLVKGTISNIENAGVLRSLTGPLVRGDVSTVKAHLENFKEQGLLVHEKVYRELSLVLLSMVKDAGFLSPDAFKSLKEILEH